MGPPRPACLLSCLPLRLASPCPRLPASPQLSGGTLRGSAWDCLCAACSHLCLSSCSVLVRPGAAVGPGRGQAAQERQCGDPRVCPRWPLQASAVSPLHRLLLVRPGGHWTPHPRHIHQVKLHPWAGEGGDGEGRPLRVPLTWRPGTQTSLGRWAVLAVCSLPCTGGLRELAALPIRSWGRPSLTAAGSSCVNDSREPAG